MSFRKLTDELDVSINNFLMFYKLYLKNPDKSVADEMKKNIAIMQAAIDELEAT